MDDYETANFRARTATIGDLYALGLVTFNDFVSSLDYLLPKVKDAELFHVILLDFVSRGLTHRAAKLPRSKWDRLYLRLPAIPKCSWEICRSDYGNVCRTMEAFEQDLERLHPYCTIPFSESTELGLSRRLDSLCSDIMAEAAGSRDKVQENLCMYMQRVQL